MAARANMLNTRTVNYMDLIGNGRVHRAPQYQRDYAWTREQWEDLWNDIVELRGARGNRRRAGEDRHYLGALVVEAKSDREFLVFDGQQRLATLSVLSLAIIAKLDAVADAGCEPEANRERSKELRNRFVGEKDPASLIESSRLFLNHADDGFYQDVLVQLRTPPNPRGLPASNRQLWDAFEYFRERLAKLPDDESKDGRALAEILSETVARGLLFILITVDDDLNAFTVFETLNARGLELTTTDLLKNYLFSKMRAKSDLDMLQRRWSKLIDVVEAPRFPDFLRYHLLCAHPQVRRRRMFKLVRDKIAAPPHVLTLMDAIEPRAEVFSALLDSRHQYWIDMPDAKPHVADLSLFGARQMMPLLLAAWEPLHDDFVRLLKLIATMTFRYSVVSRLHGARLEPAYHKAAKAVADGDVRTVRGVFEVLESIYVDDARVEADFSMLVVPRSRKKLAKYVLARLESDLPGHSCDPESDAGTIEHILPESPAADWDDSFPRRARDAATWRLGNLTLLEASANRDVGNAAYAEKIPVYTQSRYALTKAISEIAPEEWTPELVDERQRRMAKRAVHVWRADFA